MRAGTKGTTCREKRRLIANISGKIKTQPCRLGLSFEFSTSGLGGLDHVSCLWTLLPLHNFELHLIPLLQALVAFR